MIREQWTPNYLRILKWQLRLLFSGRRVGSNVNLNFQ